MCAVKLKTEQCFDLACELLELLTEHAQGIDLDAFAAERGIDTPTMEETVSYLESLSDRESGARASLAREGHTLRLLGEDGQLRPIRLRLGEGMVLSELLAHTQFDPAARARIERALLPEVLVKENQQTTNAVQIGDPTLAELIDDIASGVRINLAYRSANDSIARTRCVDPVKIEVAGDFAYLTAWDLSANDWRCYRSDRIVTVSKTEDSVDMHGEAPSMNESLSDTETTALLYVSSKRAAYLDWTGITSCDEVDGKDYCEVVVNVSSPTWLYDQVLSSQGDIEIVAPDELVEGLIAYAEKLSASVS